MGMRMPAVRGEAQHGTGTGQAVQAGPWHASAALLEQRAQEERSKQNNCEQRGNTEGTEA